MDFATVTDGTGWTYGFTFDDFDTACRAIWGEVGSEGATWEADAHLFAMLSYVRRGAKSSLAAAFRSYASPVNPRVPLTERRRRIRAMDLTDIPSAVRERIGAWMGGHPIWSWSGVTLAGLEHFSACTESAAIPHGTPDIKGPSGQCYWYGEGRMVSYAFDGRGAPAGGGGLSLLAGIAALAGAVYGATRIR